MDIEELLTKRRYLRGRATKLCVKISSELSEYNKQQMLMQKNKILSLQTELNQLNGEIFNLSIKMKKTDTELDTMMDRDEEYNEKLEQFLVKFKSWIPALVRMREAQMKIHDII